MKLRKLNKKDAALMLEWMHDDSVVHDLYTDFSKMKIEDCLNFIYKSHSDEDNLNLAIADESDVYMGTVSLKHINPRTQSAEFAITIRKTAMGKGFSIYAMNEIFKIAKQELNLKMVYWCVSKENERAIRFYNKNNFDLCLKPPADLLGLYRRDILDTLIWYSISL